MKLRCDQHDRRVFSTPNGLLHRTGELSRCESKTANIGGKPVMVLDDGTLIRPNYKESSRA